MHSSAVAAIASAGSCCFASSKPSPLFISPARKLLTCVSSSSSSPSPSPSPSPSSSSSSSLPSSSCSCAPPAPTSSSADMPVPVAIPHNAEAHRHLLPSNGDHGLVLNLASRCVSSSSASSFPSSRFHGRVSDPRFLFCAISSSASSTSLPSPSFLKLSAAFPQMLPKDHVRSLRRKLTLAVSHFSSSSSFSSSQRLSAVFGLRAENDGHSMSTGTGDEGSSGAVETPPPNADENYHRIHAHDTRMDNEGKEASEEISNAEEERHGRTEGMLFEATKQEESQGKDILAESSGTEKDRKEGIASLESDHKDEGLGHGFTAGKRSGMKEVEHVVDNSSCCKKDAIISDRHVTMRAAPRINRTYERVRRKHGVFPRNNVPQELPDLLTVPGIGPRNFEKLVSKGIAKVAELKKLYRDKFLHDESRKMVDYLRNSVGIVHRHHAESITSYVKLCVDEEIKEQLDSNKDSAPKQQKKLTICVEGNISVGKTTFLQKISNEIIELRDMVEIVPEPVDKWKDVGPDHFNLLDAFYKEPERYAYTFQNYVFASRLMKEQETSKGMKLLRLMERSIFSDRLVFVRAVHEAKWMNELELRIYESWFDPFISALPGLVPDGFIYLRASPDTCLRRLHMRNRPEEQGVTLEYLRGLHEKHEQCFFPSASSGGILSVSGLPTGSNQILPSPRIRDRVFYLEGDHLHSSIRKVPALILDCEATVDLNRDLEARAEYAQQVAEFYEYLRSNRDSKLHQTSPITFSQHSSPFLTQV